MAFNTVKPNSMPTYQGVKGSTLINHRIRIKLNLSFVQYCIMNYLDRISNKNDKVKIIWNFHEYMGIDEQQAQSEVVSLINTGFLKQEPGETIANCTIGKPWRDEFKKPTDSFDELWKILPKGSKAKALTKYMEVVQTVSHERLIERRTAYTNWKKSTNTEFQYMMGLDVWLNPKDKNWENPLPGKWSEAKSEEKEESFLTFTP